MDYKLVELLSYSVGLGAIIGLIRMHTIDKTYYPFVLLLVLGLLNEITNTIVINKGYSNALNDNIYSLLESVLLLFFFRSQKLFSKQPKVFYLFIGLYICAWVIINFYISSINTFSSYYNILYSFITVLMSISMINRILGESTTRLIKNALFQIMLGFIAFFTCKTLIEIFWVYGLNASENFRTKVYQIMTYINVSVNIIYAIAMLWIPRKREFTLL